MQFYLFKTLTIVVYFLEQYYNTISQFINWVELKPFFFNLNKNFLQFLYEWDFLIENQRNIICERYRLISCLTTTPKSNICVEIFYKTEQIVSQIYNSQNGEKINQISNFLKGEGNDNKSALNLYCNIVEAISNKQNSWYKNINWKKVFLVAGFVILVGVTIWVCADKIPDFSSWSSTNNVPAPKIVPKPVLDIVSDVATINIEPGVAVLDIIPNVAALNIGPGVAMNLDDRLTTMTWHLLEAMDLYTKLLTIGSKFEAMPIQDKRVFNHCCEFFNQTWIPLLEDIQASGFLDNL